MNFGELPRVGIRNRSAFAEAKRFSGLWVGIGSAVLSAGTSIYNQKQQSKNAQKALDAQRGIASDLKYEPIDIDAIRKEATAQAIENATQSLAIERQLQPEVASVRQELARQVNEDLKAGGNLPADVVNRVSQASRVIGAKSNVGSGGTTPLTAGLLGMSSLDLMNQRRTAASNLLAQNDLPVAGLDPGAVASLEVAQNAAQNKFNLAKSGVDSSLAESEAAVRGADIGSQVGLIDSLSNSIGKIASIYGNNKSKKSAAAAADIAV